MYARRLKYRNQKSSAVFYAAKYLIRSACLEHGGLQPLNYATLSRSIPFRDCLVRRYLSESSLSWCRNSYAVSSGNHSSSLISSQLRFYSSEGDGRNAKSEDKEESVKNEVDINKGRSRLESERAFDDTRACDAHARLGEQDQKEWLHNEKVALENKEREMPFLSRREKFKNEFLRRVVPWEKITVSWDTFPYYIQ